MYRKTEFDIHSLLRSRPLAAAIIKGSVAHTEISGFACFYGTDEGTVVRFDVRGLPKGDGRCGKPIFACHVHDGISCNGNASDPFAAALGHFNPEGCPHPYHAGDMPPLFSANGRAMQIFLTDRFKVSDIIDKTVIIHTSPDDFTSQPAGNAGERIACGVIRRMIQIKKRLF